MKNLFSKVLLLLTAAIMVSGCGGCNKAKDARLFIPKDAIMVGVINTKQVMEKAEWNTLFDLPFMKKAMERIRMEAPQMERFLKDPASMGVDINQNAYVFGKVSPGMGGGGGGLVASLLDVTKLANALKEIGLSVKDEGGFKVASMEGVDLVGFNDKVVFFGNSTDNQGFIKEILTMTSSNSIASNKGLNSAVAQAKDFTLWVSTDEIADDLKKLPGYDQGLAAAGFKGDIASGNELVFSYDFLKGKAETHMDIKWNSNLKDAFQPMLKSKVATDFSAFMGGEGLSLSGIVGLDPKGIESFLNKGMLGFGINAGLRETGMTMNDIVETFDGDLMFNSYASSNPANPNFMAGFKIKKQENIAKIIQAYGLGEEGLVKDGDGWVYNYTTYSYPSLTEMQEMMNAGGDYSPKEVAEKFHIFPKNGILFVSNNEAAVAAVKAGGFANDKRVPADKYKEMNSHTMGVYGNYGSYWQYMGLEMFGGKITKDSKITKILGESMGWADFDKSFGYINVNNQDKNSLRAIIEALGELAEVYMDAAKPAGDPTLDEMLEEELSKENL